MDSLLASYASSDEEGEDQRSSDSGIETSSSLPPPNEHLSLRSALPPPTSFFSNPTPQPKSSIFSSLPPPKSNESTRGSLFSALPPPKSKESTKPRASDTNPNRSVKEGDSYEGIEGDTGDASPFTAPSSLFSVLPPAKSNGSTIFSSIPALRLKKSTDSLGLDANHKKVVHFTPPVNPSLQDVDDQDVDDEEEEENKKQNSFIEPFFSTSSSLSSVLPAPKNTLCLAPQSSSSNIFSSRGSTLAAQLPPAKTEPAQVPVQYETNQSYDPNGVGNLAQTGYMDTSSSGYAIEYGNMENYAGYDGYNWSADASLSNATGTSVAMEVPDVGKTRGKRGRNEMPPQVVEVKQDELMKNRPRQDQAKLTGIAFGPSYQVSFALP